MKKTTLLLATLLVSMTALSDVARAEANAPAPLPPAPAPAVANKSPVLAPALSLAAIGVTIGFSAYAIERDSSAAGTIALVGIAVGPAAGHLYAGEYMHAALTTSVRTLGALLIFHGLTIYDREDSDPSVTASLTGLGLIAGTTIYDLVDGYFAVRRTNVKRRAAVQMTGSVMSSHGQTVPAFVVAGTF
ncbi:MAG: hypothetical protein SFX73_40775 [Kofleriaceae bacterium]|nr:hypothetical protein [Kofleriaceae bacterium]